MYAVIMEPNAHLVDKYILGGGEFDCQISKSSNAQGYGGEGGMLSLVVHLIASPYGWVTTTAYANYCGPMEYRH